MSYFSDLALVESVAAPNAPTKPLKYTFGIRTEDQLEEFCEQWQLTEEEKWLLNLTELQGYTLNQIASVLGTSRQNVSQKRCNLYRRINKRQQKLN